MVSGPLDAGLIGGRPLPSVAARPDGAHPVTARCRTPEAPGSDAPWSVAVALGANLGDPLATLLALRPLLAEALQEWWGEGTVPRLRWSPLFRTAPVGGPADQPDYLNAVLLLEGGPAGAPADPPGLQGAPPPQGAMGPTGEATAGALSQPEPLALLERLQALERRFGRVRGERWGPRTLDLDLLWCGPAALDQPGLELPHPRLRQRAFVLAPLAAIDPAALVPPAGGLPPARAAELLRALPLEALEPPPQRLPGRAGWPE